MVVVNGTDHDSLAKGPVATSARAMPGEGELVYIAGHRTTYGARSSRIEELRRGDPRDDSSCRTAPSTTGSRGTSIVEDTALRGTPLAGHEVIALQACHPRFFASHRDIAYAEPVRILPRG